MRKLNVFFLPFILLLTTLLSSCNIRTIKGDGNVASREIQITGYTEIEIQGENIDFTYIQSDNAPSLKIESDQNILNSMQMEVKKDKLIIRPKEYNVTINPTRFIVTTNSSALEELKIGGSGNYTLAKKLTGNHLELSLAGSSTITIDSLIMNKIECNIAGNGNIILRGKTKQTDIRAAGNCKVSAFDLQTEKLSCKMAGNNEIEITVNQEINAKIAGSGSLLYKGNPNIIKDKSVGSVTISKVD